jgi:L-iditol 2-dehydrogenase
VRLAVLREPGRFDLVDDVVPGPTDDEVLVRVTHCGVCASELDMFQGRLTHGEYPWFPGHEVSGVVEKTGSLAGTFSPGDPVACWVTTRGYAEYVSVKEEHCFHAGSVPLDLALGEPLACAVNTVEAAAPSLGDDVVIVGAGFMGHLIQKLVHMRGPRQVIVADARSDALERARGFGATRTVDIRGESLVDVVCELTGQRGADVTFEVTGVQAALEAIHEYTRMSGTVVLAGYHQGEPRLVPLGDWNWKAFRVVNAHFRDVTTIMRGFAMGMRLLTSGTVSLDGLVTHSFSLDRIDDAFRTAIDKPEGFVKATVTP